MLYKIFLIAFLFLYNCNAFAQVVPAHYRITFRDKHNNPFTLNNPSQYLSQRAIERRQKTNIQITENDIPITPAYIDSIVKIGAIIINKSKWFNSIVVYITDSNYLTKINTLSSVLSIDRISKVYTDTTEMPQFSTTIKNDDFINELYNNISPLDTQNKTYKYDYGKSYKQINMLGGDYLHINGFNGEGMLIAVFDVGFIGVPILHAFDSLRNQGRIICTKDLVTPNGDVFNNGTHGLYVLSILTAYQSGEFIGTAPGASYILLRTECNDTENPVEEDNWSAGAEFADSSGADIISSSLGYTLFNDSTQNHTYSNMNGHTTRATQAALIASQKGILVINSAGNSGSKPWYYIGAPADADSIIAVGAIDSIGNHAPFSSYGPTFDGRTKPDVCAMGFETYMITLSGETESGNGTSFSAPIISGLAACLWQMFPNKSNMEIRNAIISSANQYLSPSNITGYGIPNFYNAATILNGNEVITSNNLTASISSSNLNIFIFTENEDEFTFTIYTLEGQPIESFNKKCSRGYNYLYFNLRTNIPNGIFILQVNNNNGNIINTKVFKSIN